MLLQIKGQEQKQVLENFAEVERLLLYAVDDIKDAEWFSTVTEHYLCQELSESFLRIPLICDERNSEPWISRRLICIAHIHLNESAL